MAVQQRPFTVKAVARLLGVSPNTVRAWETRYGAVEPARTDTNRRGYTLEDVDRLRLILKLVNCGHSVGAIAGLSEKRLIQLLDETQSEKDTLTHEARNISAVIESLTRYDFASVVERLERFRLSNSTRDYVINVLSPILGEVGQLVDKGRLSVAQEHALSAMIRDQVGQTIHSLRTVTPPHGPSFLFTTPEGELHEFGILLSAALCAHYGFKAFYLGPNLPAQALCIAVDALKPDFVVLGTSRATTPDAPTLLDYLKTLAQHLNPNVSIWIGGEGPIPHLRAIFGKREYQVLSTLMQFDSNIGKLR